jgi:hypothetical protein
MALTICNTTPLYDENCIPPYDIHPSYVGVNSIILTWSNTEADSYTLYISDDGTTWTTQAVAAPTDPAINPSQTVSGLTASTTYYFKVRTNCDGPLNSDGAIISVLTNAS